MGLVFIHEKILQVLTMRDAVEGERGEDNGRALGKRMLSAGSKQVSLHLWPGLMTCFW
jgi:hypothetical protein